MTFRAFGMTTVAIAFAGSMLLATAAQAREWKIYENKKYGYSIKIPAEFELQSEDKSTSFIYQPGSVATGESGTTKKKKKKFSIGTRIGGVNIGTSQSEETSSESSGSSGGGLESALSIHINWVWMPDVAPGTLYNANMDSVKKDMTSPDPNYTDPINFDKKKFSEWDSVYEEIVKSFKLIPIEN